MLPGRLLFLQNVKDEAFLLLFFPALVTRITLKHTEKYFDTIPANERKIMLGR